MRWLGLAWGVWLSFACGEPAATGAPPKPVAASATQPSAPVGEPVPSAQLSAAKPAVVAESSRARAAVPVARGCALRSQLALDPATRLGSVIARGSDALLLLQLSDGRGSVLALVRSDGTQLFPEQRMPLAQPLALRPVSHVHTDGVLSIALVDDQGTLSLLRLAHGKLSAPRVLARGLDRRFAPSLASAGPALLVAYTQTVDSAMHTFVARVRGERVDLHDVTPISHGATAATFVLGAGEPTLVMLDARAGVSPLLEVDFAPDGRPLPAVVRTPVSQPYAPPLLSAVQLPEGEVQVAYTAIGRAAATAVGLVPLRRAAAPSALLPSLGYGSLSMAAVVSGRGAVFALEAPTSSAADAPHTLVVKLLDEAGEGPALTITGEAASLTQPSLAAGARPGELYLLYAAGARLTLSVLDCDL